MLIFTQQPVGVEHVGAEEEEEEEEEEEYKINWQDVLFLSSPHNAGSATCGCNPSGKTHHDMMSIKANRAR